MYQRLECLAAVFTDRHKCEHIVESVLVRRIDEDLFACVPIVFALKKSVGRGPAGGAH